MIIASLILFWPNSNVSSAYCKLQKFEYEEPGKPAKRPAFFPFSIMLLSPSTASTSKRVDMRSSS